MKNLFLKDLKNIFKLSTKYFNKSIVKNFFNEIINLERHDQRYKIKIKSALSIKY